MSDEPKKRSRAWVWMALVAILVLYPLSVGPAAWIVARTDSPAAYAFTKVAYAPVRWLTSNSSVLNDVAYRYTTWCAARGFDSR
ncbi:MAG TPA: hypothetical protein VGP63_29175 [Planctomycetaceae bacterium]|jgi:hypothetical protein|nr:hypothetical protein [Planctomycetaceae bacterium]